MIAPEARREAFRTMVSKLRYARGHFTVRRRGQQWIVTNHDRGTHEFRTRKAAVDYIQSRIMHATTYNDAVVTQIDWIGCKPPKQSKQ